MFTFPIRRSLFVLCISTAPLVLTAMPSTASAVSVALGAAASNPAPHSQSAIQSPGCDGLEPKQCLNLAIEAMGGRDRLAAIHNLKLDVIAHTALVEQSYRQAPFITSYERDQIVIDHEHQRLMQKQHSVWPEADLKGADSDVTLIVTPAGGVYRFGTKDAPCGASDLDATRDALALSPEAVLLTAAEATDLHYAATESLRSTPHTVLAFTWNKTPVKVLVNRFNHLPDAVETTQQFRDFWFYWGDVQQRVYFDNWRFVQGIEYPSNQITERNGILWNSTQALDIEFNAASDDKDFNIDAKAAAQSLQSKGWNRPFSAANSQQLAPGIDLFQGSWNTTIVKQNDGIVILETPISGTFTQGIFDEARKRYPEQNIAAILSTSDSWPHTGGVRYDVAEGLPVYILDLNKPLLDRIVAAPHTLDPDALAKSKKQANWHIVSGRTEIGAGPNRMILYPLRGASTERQYMVYFPEHQLLYASDTLVLNPDHTLYDPELFREVQQAVEHEHLQVKTVYAMHQAPVSWSEVIAVLQKSLA